MRNDAIRQHFRNNRLPVAMFVLYIATEKSEGRDSSVGTATRYGLDGPGIESRWGQDFRHLSIPALGPTHNGYRVFPGG